MKILVFCNTYSQLILAVQLKLTLFKDDDVDLWLSDTSIGAESVFERIHGLHLFNESKFLRFNYSYFKQNKWDNLKDLYSYNFKSINDIFPLYDEIVFYNIVLQIYRLSDYYYSIGHHPVWSRMEEGIFSYNTDFNKSKRIQYSRIIRKYIKRPDVFNYISRYYCVYPFLKTTHLNWDIIKIPDYSTTQKELCRILNQLFDYKPKKIEYKYIFFASSSDIDGVPFGETELILKLTNLLGKGNIILKTHPRDGRTIYSEKGIHVLKNSHIPWEVIQLNLQVDSITFLTVNSGSFISISAMLNKSYKGFFLYNIPNCHTDAFVTRKEEIHQMLVKLHQKDICIGITDDIMNLEEICKL